MGQKVLLRSLALLGAAALMLGFAPLEREQPVEPSSPASQVTATAGSDTSSVSPVTRSSPLPTLSPDPEPATDAPTPAADVSGGASVPGEEQAAECEGGMAGPFPCENVDLESVLPLGGAGVGTGNDVWGWTDPSTGNEYAVVGSALATTFVDVTDPESPQTVGYLPTAEDAPPDFVLWRDVKVSGNWAFIVSEITGHGMQVFDLTRLRDADPVPQIFTADAHYRGTDEEGVELGNAHNIAVNEETDFAYIVGSNTCVSAGPEGQNGGLHMVDISDPANPEFAGCALVTNPARNNYIHDVQCVIYRGPDADYRGREICFGSNEDVVAVYDVTDKDNPVVLSQWGYPQAAYTHQGWLTEDHRYFLFGDELDEQGGTVDNTTTYIMRTSDLDAPQVPKAFSHETRSIDHNLYIRDRLVYQSNYGAGLRILKFSNNSLANGQLNEVGYFDIRPGFDEPEFAGTWSNYPYFESGIVVMTSLEEGTSVLYVLRPTGDAAGEDTGGGGGNGGGNGGGGSGNGSGSSGGDDGQDDDPQARGETTGGAEGSGLGVTGADLVLFLLLGLGLVTTGAAIQTLRRARDS